MAADDKVRCNESFDIAYFRTSIWTDASGAADSRRISRQCWSALHLMFSQKYLQRRRLRAKPIRTASGIAVVAVMSKPHRCPHIATTGDVSLLSLQIAGDLSA
jgi:hypothetical protein